MKYFNIDVIIPTLNEEKNIRSCLESIFRQNYPRENFSVTVVDGGSKDNTVKIAKEYGCKVIYNEKKLAEPGVLKGINCSTSDLCCILAVDNIIVNDNDFFNLLVKPFERDNVIGTFPLVICKEDEPLINKYINNRAEPFSEFIYGNACNTRTYNLVYTYIYKSDDYEIFNFYDKINVAPPLLALAQGFTVKKEYFIRYINTENDDLLPIVELIKSARDLAYVPKANIYHYQMMSMKVFVKKMTWRVKRNIVTDVHKKKLVFFTKSMKIKRLLWPFYAVSLILPLINAIFYCIKEKKIFYFYHFLCTIILFFIILKEYIKSFINRLIGYRELGTYK
jgi:glycosyltransferase involved in cell wall biosynthesis